MNKKYYSGFNSVVNYINVSPFLYRYEDDKWIDKFFETGELLISSFHQYAQYEDNQLGDKSEGQTINIGNTENGQSIYTVTGTGNKSFTFCTSTVLDKNLLKTFKRNSVFRIKEPLSFINQIEKSLPRVIEVLHGHCVYLERKTIEKSIPNIDLNELKADDGSNNIEMDKLLKETNKLNGPEQYFIKR